MTIEHRLQHAARELRELQIDVPPLGTKSVGTRRSLLQTLAAPMLVPMLFVAGGLVAIGASRAEVTPSTQSDIPNVSPATVTPADPNRAATPPQVDADPVASSPPSMLVELAMIADVPGERSGVRSVSSADTGASARQVGYVVGPL